MYRVTMVAGETLLVLLRPLNNGCTINVAPKAVCKKKRPRGTLEGRILFVNGWSRSPDGEGG